LEKKWTVPHRKRISWKSISLEKTKKGEVIPHTDGKDVKIRLGFGRLLEDLEKGICGLQPGEEKTGIKVRFPKNYHNATMAGMTTKFDVKLNSVHEISVKNLDETLIEKITGKKKPMAEFRDEIRKLITQNKTQAEKQKKIKEYQDKLAKTVKIELPASWITNEVESRITQLKQSPQYKHDPENFWKQAGKTEEEIKKEFEKRASHDLKIFLGLSEIIKKENIELDKDEVKKAGEITNKQLAREDQKDKNYEEEFNKTILNLKIDKYLSGLMI